MPIDLTGKMKERLPAELFDFMRRAGEGAERRGWHLYLVGGVVRDLLLGQANLDIDLVVEGTALELAKELAPGAKVTYHPAFLTVTFRWGKWRIDIATARSEKYSRPGALPAVKPGAIDEDLARRDFTINAMAVCLNPVAFGKLIDPLHGVDDIEKKLIRILHDRSFIDDATRIWRAVRYEQRLDFNIEPHTLELLKRDLAMLGAINGDRIRHELALVMEEQYPEKVLNRADKLGILARVHPALKGNGWLAEKLLEVRKAAWPRAVGIQLYWALLTYRLSVEEAQELAQYLRLPRSLAQVIQDTDIVKAKLPDLDRTDLNPSEIYCLLHGCSSVALIAISLAANSPLVRNNINLFLDKLRYIKPKITGDDLISLGVAPGEQMRELLHRLHKAILDRPLDTRQAELSLVQEWLRQRRGEKI